MLNISIIGSDSTHTDAYAYYLNCTNMFKGVKCTSLWGADYSQAKIKAKKLNIVTVYESLDEAILSADLVIIALRYGEDHFLPAKRSLELGRPTFVDKPFVNSIDEANKLSHLSKLLKTPLSSFSPVSLHDDFTDLKSCALRLKSGDKISISSPANSLLIKEKKASSIFYYGIHAIDLLLSITGNVKCHLEGIRDDNKGIYAKILFDNMVRGEINLIYDLTEEYCVDVFSGGNLKRVCIGSNIKSCFANTLAVLMDNLGNFSKSTILLDRSTKAISILSEIEKTITFRR
jgi:predicted dehydrogenase